MMQTLYTQTQTNIGTLLQKRQDALTRADRRVEELNWRLNTSGGVINIDIQKAAQAFSELRDALREIREVELDLAKYPEELRRPQ